MDSRVTKLPSESEVIVIGGGIFGCSIAYHLAKKGKETILLEKRNICSGASGRNGGQVIQLEGREKEPANIKKRLALTRENNIILKTLSRELKIDLEYRRTGSLDIAFTKEEWKELEYVVKIQEKAGDREIALLTKEETLRLCPLLTQEIKGARYRPSDGTINPFFYTRGLAENFVKHKGEIFTWTEVKKILRKNGKVCGIETTTGQRIRAEKVVNVTNAWSSFLIPEIDILPLRQTAVVTEPAAPLPVCPVEAFIKGEAIYANIQSERGNLIAGGLDSFRLSRQRQYEERIFLEEVRGNAKIFSCLYPSLKDLSIIRAWAGTMALGPDFAPVVGKVPESEGLYMAAGFYNGMAYAAIVGELMSEMIISDRTPSLLECFDPAKYYRRKFVWPKTYNCTSLAEFFARK
ncbi:MAG: FAD-binding oxidoreductase [Candidatus Omnitrophica bacterium]|nr:FAD-binding oxidoreductase [Candidatus Omnitrophota bacterium]